MILNKLYKDLDKNVTITRNRDNFFIKILSPAEIYV